MSGLPSSFNIKFLGSYVHGEHTVYVVAPDGTSEKNFKKKTDKGSPGKTEAPLSRLSNKGSNDFGLSLNFKEGTMHYLKIKTGQEEALRSAMLEVLGEVRSGRRPPSNWGVFFDRLKEVKQFDFETLKDLWVAGKEAQKAAQKAAQRASKKLVEVGAKPLVQEVKQGLEKKRKNTLEKAPYSDFPNTRVRQKTPGFLLENLYEEGVAVDFLLAPPGQVLHAPDSPTVFWECLMDGGSSESQTASFSAGVCHDKPYSFFSLERFEDVDESDGRSSTRSPV